MNTNFCSYISSNTLCSIDKPHRLTSSLKVIAPVVNFPCVKLNQKNEVFSSAQFVAALALAFSFGRFSFTSSSTPFFCSLSASANEPVIQAQITIEVKKHVEMSTKDSEICDWLETVKKEAIERGVSEDTIIHALENVEPSENIIQKDQTQPEKTLTADAYLKRMVSDYRVSQGVKAFAENKSLLNEVSQHYGVPPSVLASIWGIESNYGSFPGSWNVIQALVTLAFNSPESRRREFFREELFHALFILDSGEGPDLKGSWAGAMGQCQFMPSSYRTYAVDFDNDGRKDIWTSNADIFASISNYLVKHGWEIGGKIAHKVVAPADIDKALCNLDVKKSVGEWINEHNVVPCEDLTVDDHHHMVSLVAPDGPSGAAYLVWNNFRVVMKYNISTLYAISVYELAREIDSRASQEANKLMNL